MLSLLFALVYVQAGFQLGKKAAKTWKKGDSASLESFLLFPVSHARGKVGDADMPFMGGINGGDTFFRVLVTLGWPVMVAWNALLVLGLFGPDKIIKRLTSGPPTYEERIARILEEEKKVDRVIAQLESGQEPGKKTRKRAPKKPKALAAPASAAVPPKAVFEPPPPPISNGVPTAAFFEPPQPASHAEHASPPVQVRVTVDVTAPGPSADDTDRAEHDAAASNEKRLAAEHDRIVH